MAEWYTRWSQKPLDVNPCGFESHLRHIVVGNLASDKQLESILGDGARPSRAHPEQGALLFLCVGATRERLARW